MSVRKISAGLVLASLFVLKEKLTIQERYLVMRMMFGGHIDRFDYHMVGLSVDFLATFLAEAGFVNVRKVPGFGLFQDTSAMMFKGVPISLNVVAEKAR